jgi:hypothetical protein
MSSKKILEPLKMTNRPENVYDFQKESVAESNYNELMLFKGMILKGCKTKLEQKLNSKEFSELKLRMNIEIKKKNFNEADKLQKEFNSKYNELK